MGSGTLSSEQTLQFSRRDQTDSLARQMIRTDVGNNPEPAAAERRGKPRARTSTLAETMKTMASYILGLLLAASCVAGEDGTKGTAAEGQTNQLARFDGLFLTNAPLRYQDCHSLLCWVDYESHLDAKGKLAVCAKLKAFLSRKTARRLAADSTLTGLAAPEAILRAYAAHLLGKLGTAEDISFLEEFAKIDQSTLPEGIRYGVTTTECGDAIRKIRERDSANKPSDRTR